MSIAIPVTLFVLLSPGLLFRQSAVIHTMIFMATYWAVAKAMGVALSKADLVIPTVLFFLLSPPSGGDLNTIILRALVFAIIFALVRKYF